MFLPTLLQTDLTEDTVVGPLLEYIVPSLADGALGKHNYELFLGKHTHVIVQHLGKITSGPILKVGTGLLFDNKSVDVHVKGSVVHY